MNNRITVSNVLAAALRQKELRACKPGALSLQKWFGIRSDPELENQINDRISFKVFIGPPFGDLSELYFGGDGIPSGGIPGEVHDACQGGMGSDVSGDSLQHQEVVPGRVEESDTCCCLIKGQVCPEHGNAAGYKEIEGIPGKKLSLLHEETDEKNTNQPRTDAFCRITQRSQLVIEDDTSRFSDGIVSLPRQRPVDIL